MRCSRKRRTASVRRKLSVSGFRNPAAYTVKLRHAAVYIAIIITLTALLPYFCIKLFPQITTDTESITYRGTLPKTVKVYITAERKTKTIPFEKYVQGVVASEMPSSFEKEALKAQAVASRTYALGRMKAGTKLCDSVHCQVYREDNISRKVKNAVKSTCGQVLLSKGKLAASALYFSSSAGPTENAEDVFTTPHSYLVSVKSSYEPGATHKKETCTLTINSFVKKMRKTLPDAHFGKVTKNNIRIISRTKGGRADTVRIGKEEVSGSDIRTALGLYSCRFKISFIGNKKITITTAGSGHGVGMSQYGANGLAKKGKSYEDILSHYYQGTQVSAKTK